MSQGTNRPAAFKQVHGGRQASKHHLADQERQCHRVQSKSKDQRRQSRDTPGGEPVKTAKLHFCAIVTMLLCVVSQALGQAGTARFPESRSYSPGKLWLEWTLPERTGFVRGFIVGHGEGYQQACNAST